jgi:hypothetical protein
MTAPKRFANLPARIKRLPLDARGFPVPWFVAWLDGAPDFRIIGPGKIHAALDKEVCWICGDKLGSVLAFTVGPMCLVNRLSSEPPAHLECARFAATACPFLTTPAATRNERGLPAEMIDPPGLHSPGNPAGCVVICCYRFTAFEVGAAHRTMMFQIGKPTKVEWFTLGRRASRAEALALLAVGTEKLKRVAEVDPDPAAALRELGLLYGKAMAWLPVSRAVRDP